VTTQGVAPGVQVAWRPVDDQPDAADRLAAGEVADLLGCDVADVRLGRSCQHCGSSGHGRPVVLAAGGEHPPYISLSRAPGLVLVGVSREVPIGVDVEKDVAAGPAGAADLLHAEERARTSQERTTVWVRKESLLKATGDGLLVDPTRIRLTDADEEPRLLEWSGGPSLPGTWMHDLSIDGYAACLTLLGSTDAISRPPEASAAASR
jgi:4'-phosphopantetheinyl transferase